MNDLDPHALAFDPATAFGAFVLAAMVTLVLAALLDVMEGPKA